jgi:hypothetical protein
MKIIAKEVNGTPVEIEITRHEEHENVLVLRAAGQTHTMTLHHDHDWTPEELKKQMQTAIEVFAREVLGRAKAKAAIDDFLGDMPEASAPIDASLEV